MSSAESIYKLVEKPKAEERPKGPLYKSKYDPKGPLIGSTFGMEGTTAVDGKGVHSIKKVSSSSLSLHWDHQSSSLIATTTTQQSSLSSCPARPML